MREDFVCGTVRSNVGVAGKAGAAGGLCGGGWNE